MKLDEKYLDIIELLKEDSNLTSSEISKKLDIPASTAHNRIKKLEREGIIKGYTVVLDYQKLGKPLLAHILIKTMHRLPDGKKISQDEIAKKIKKLGADEVSTVLVDEADILASIRKQDLYSIKKFTKKVQEVVGVARTHTLIVLSRI